MRHGEKCCLFEHHGPNGSIKINIWSCVLNMCNRKNNSIRTTTSERGFEIDFIGSTFDSYSAANAIQAVTNLYLYKKIKKEAQSINVSTATGSFLIWFGLSQVEGIPPICWATQISKEKRTGWVCMPVIVAHQFNSALIKAMNWYTPLSYWDGERHVMPENRHSY